MHYTAAHYASAYGFAEKHMAEYSRLDATLNTLDAYAASAAQRSAGVAPALAAQLAGVRAKALALRAQLTADQTNDEDSIQRPGRIREDLGGLFFTAGRPADRRRAGLRRAGRCGVRRDLARIRHLPAR